jgi:rieske iron-sulfur protein
VVKWDDENAELSRRDVLLAAMGAGLGISALSLLVVAGGLEVQVKVTPENAPPRKGDLLVFAAGPHEGRIIAPDDVPSGGPLILAWPMDPVSKVVRSRNPKNIVLLVRAKLNSWFTAAEAPRTAADVAAYSATCTHLCCTVSNWIPRPFGIDPHGLLFCPCHKSHFDPWDGATVLAGPAPRPLPALPLDLVDGNLVVADGFLTAVGCTTV